MTYEGLILPALWIATLGVALVFVARAALARRAKGKAETAQAAFNATQTARSSLIGAGVAALVAVLVVPAIGVVPAGHRGVVYSIGGGVASGERGEGVTLLAPWVQHMRVMSVRTQKVFSKEVFSQSLDLQEITVVASVNYHVEPDRAAELYQTVGPEYQSTVIQPALFQRTKAAVGQVFAEDFAENRGKLATTIQQQLASQLDSYGIVVEFVNIEDAIFDPAFVQSVKEKVIAEQEAAEQENLIEAEAAKKEQAILQAEARARSVAIEAEAQAKANVLLARSLSAQLLRWRYLIEWDGILPKTLVNGRGVALLLDGKEPIE